MPFTEEDILALKGLLAEELKDVKHNCIQEGVLGGIVELYKRVATDIYGNGHEGLSKTVPQQTQRIDALNISVIELKTAVQGILKYVNERTGADMFEESHRLSSRQKTQIWIAAIIGSAGIATTLLINLL